MLNFGPILDVFGPVIGKKIKIFKKKQKKPSRERDSTHVYQKF